MRLHFVCLGLFRERVLQRQNYAIGDTMDLKIFQRQLIKAYNASQCVFSLKECFDIFKFYFECYKLYMGREHPHLRTSKLTELLNDLDGNGFFESEDYPYLIEQYFVTPFNCDRNIVHFFSGDIRTLRFYEACY